MTAMATTQTPTMIPIFTPLLMPASAVGVGLAYLTGIAVAFGTSVKLYSRDGTL